jgi:hypothetical protein
VLVTWGARTCSGGHPSCTHLPGGDLNWGGPRVVCGDAGGVLGGVAARGPCGRGVPLAVGGGQGWGLSRIQGRALAPPQVTPQHPRPPLPWGPPIYGGFPHTLPPLRDRGSTLLRPPLPGQPSCVVCTQSDCQTGRRHTPLCTPGVHPPPVNNLPPAIAGVRYSYHPASTRADGPPCHATCPRHPLHQGGTILLWCLARLAGTCDHTSQV